jgi:hypothetical protein
MAKVKKGYERAVLPSLDHFTLEDADHVYEPAEDTYLLCDALLKDKSWLIERRPLVIAELGYKPADYGRDNYLFIEYMCYA